MNAAKSKWKKFFVVLLGQCLIIFSQNIVWADIPQGYFTDIEPVAGISSDYADFSPTISYDGLQIFFASVDYPDGNRPGGKGGEDIWMASRKCIHEPFGNLRNVSEINSSARDSGLAISSDGLTIIFSSDKSGGSGGYDLYQATRPDPNHPFENVTNLGPQVNSSYAEWDPCLSPDGLTLYFTSGDRLPNMGDSDIWMTTRASIEEPFGEPVHLGSPNSSYAEFSVNLSSDGLIILFSDFQMPPFRPGGKGSADIWLATRTSIFDPFGETINLNDLWPGTEINSSLGEGYVCLAPDWPSEGSKIYYATDRDTTLYSANIWQATWVSACQYAIQGDLNDDCRVDLSDVAIVAGNWLVDCIGEPDDPACVSK